MKKACFYFALAAALTLFCLFSCAQTDSLYDVLLSVTANDESLPAGSLLCYGRAYKNGASDDFLSDYLWLSGYPAFKDKIEEMAVYSSLGGAFCELAVMKLYSASDAQDGKLFFERRAAEAERALKTAEIEGYAENARIETRGNFVILSMMPDNDAAIEKLKKALG